MRKWKCLGSADCYMENPCVVEMDDTLEPVSCLLAGGSEWEEVVAPANTVQRAKERRSTGWWCWPNASMHCNNFAAIL